MKHIFIILSLFSFSAFAAVPSEIAKFVDKRGTLIGGGPCTVRIDRDGVLEIENYDYHYSPTADLKEAEKFVDNNGTVTFKIKEYEYQPGDATECGNYRIINSKKTVVIKGKVLSVRTRTRCLFAGTMEIERSCKIR